MLDLDMSPYAGFVWPAWAVSALVLAGLAARAAIAARRWKRELARLEVDQPSEPAQSAAGLKERPQAAQSAVGRTESPEAAQSAAGQEE